MTHDICEYARRGNVAMLQDAISKGKSINAMDDTGKSPLLCAIAWRQMEAVAWLLENGADASAQDHDGKSALHYAIEFKLPMVVEAVLRKCPSAVSTIDKHGNQPLWTAAFNARGDYTIVKMLLRYGADATHRNNVDLSPLDIPIRKHEPALLEILEGKITN